MRSLICLAITGLFFATVSVHAGPGRGNGNFKTVSSADKYETDVSIHVTAVAFSPRDIEVIRAHYAPQSLPPGLAKKVARGGQLPPGWQRKMQPFPAELDRVMLPLPGAYRRGIFEGHAVIYNGGTIVDVVAIL